MKEKEELISSIDFTKMSVSKQYWSDWLITLNYDCTMASLTKLISSMEEGIGELLLNTDVLATMECHVRNEVEITELKERKENDNL